MREEDSVRCRGSKIAGDGNNSKEESVRERARERDRERDRERVKESKRL